MVQALAAYDVHIGQRNWNELTPFGESRMNNHVEVGILLHATKCRKSIPVFHRHYAEITLRVAYITMQHAILSHGTPSVTLDLNISPSMNTGHGYKGWATVVLEMFW